MVLRVSDTLSRRQLIHSLAAFAAVAFTGRALAADALRIVVGSTSGSSLDLLAREFAGQFRTYLGVPVEVENDAGGSGRFAVSAASAARGNPNLMSFVPGSMIYGAMTDDELARQFSGLGFLGSMGRNQRVLLVAKATGISSFADVLGTKTRLTLATPFATSASHFETLITNAVTGSRLVPVGGYGAGRKVALLSGEVNAALGSLDTYSDMMLDGTLTPVLALNRPVAGSAIEGIPVLEDFADTDSKRRLVEIVSAAAEADQMLVVPPDIPKDAFERLEGAFLGSASKVVDALRAKDGEAAALPNDTVRLRQTMSTILLDRTLYSLTLKAAVDCGNALADGRACTP